MPRFGLLFHVDHDFNHGEYRWCFIGESSCHLSQCLSDGRITLFESSFLLILYAGYITIMWYASPCSRFERSIFRSALATTNDCNALLSADGKYSNRSVDPLSRSLITTKRKSPTECEVPMVRFIVDVSSIETRRLFLLVERFDDDTSALPNNSSASQNQIPIDDLIAIKPAKLDFETAAVKLMMSKRFRGRTRFRMATRFVITEVGLKAFGRFVEEESFRCEQDKVKVWHVLINQHRSDASHSIKDEHRGRICSWAGMRDTAIFSYLYDSSLLAAEENYDDWKSIPNYAYDPVNFAKWIVTAPIKIIFHFTIPDCRNPR